MPADDAAQQPYADSTALEGYTGVVQPPPPAHSAAPPPPAPLPPPAHSAAPPAPPPPPGYRQNPAPPYQPYAGSQQAPPRPGYQAAPPQNAYAPVPYGHQAAPAYGYVQPNPSMQQTAALMQRKSSGLAIFLSFLLPGLGQFYGGSPGKGVLFLVFDAFNVLLLFVLIGFVTAPICWIWSMIDASSTVDRYNARVLMTAYGAPPAY